MSAFKKFIREKISFRTLVYWILIYLILTAVNQGVALVIRGTSSEVLSPLILLGVLWGWWVGRSTLKPWLSLLISFISGVLVTLLHIGGIGSVFWMLVKSGSNLLWNGIFSRPISDPGEINTLLALIQTRISEVASSFLIWMNDLISGFYVYNQVSTLLSWGFLMWSLAVWFSWITRRRFQPLGGLIPAGILLAILMTYTLEKRFLLVLLLGAGLMLVGFINLEEKSREWKKIGVNGAVQVRENSTLAVTSLSLGIMLVAGLTPSISIRAISDPIENWLYKDSQTGETGLDSPRAEAGFNQDLYTIERFTGLPRQKLIGSGPELLKRIVMIVQFPTTSFVKSELPNAARYWRSYSYDQYTGSGWQSSPTIEVEYKPGQEISREHNESFDIITQEIRLSNALRGSLYSAGAPLTLDHEVLVSWRTSNKEAPNGNNQITEMEDIFAATLDQILYQVRSLISTASDDDLRMAEDSYPDWVTDRYLKLPDSVPHRVKNLASEIVANQPSRYDQAKTIELFLRSYPYTLSLPAPPTDRDVADYFLFDLQTGYCDYYATSMVVLARAVGLPSRVVVGYVGGQYDEENNQYLVSEADAHTWVEVYFNGYGWIPFEPTAARNLIDEDALSLPLPPELELPSQTSEAVGQMEFPGSEVSLGVFVLLIIGMWFWNRIDLARLQHMDTTSLALEIYQRLFKYGRWVGLGHHKSDTLNEFNQRLKNAFSSLETNPRREKRLAGGEIEISQLTKYAILANYSVRPLGEELSGDILLIWKRLRIRMRYVIWISAWKSLGRKIFKRENKDVQLNLIINGAADGKG